MTRLFLLAPLALAASGTPCPVPVDCVGPLPDGDGSAAYLAAMPEPTTPPDHNDTKDDSNGHGSSDGSNSSDGGKSDE